LIYDARLFYDVKVMMGVAAYVQEHSEWSLFIEEKSLHDQQLPNSRIWEGDGILANFDDRRVAAAVVKSKLPAVGFGGGYGWYHKTSRIPYFLGDDGAIAELAAEHLLDRGLRQFAYCGYPTNAINGWSNERGRAFAARVNRQGFRCEAYRGRRDSDFDWVDPQRMMCTWLRSLPKPVGLMAANDHRARQVLEACRVLGLRVPEDVAVIGVDNDELICQLSTPPLSSVEHGAKQLGYLAAGLLDQMMQGKKGQNKLFIVAPVGVKARQSTNVLAVEDPVVRAAVAFISEHAREGIKVKHVLQAAGVSRSGLEKRFRATLGYTIYKAVQEAQLQQVRRLVTETKLPLKEVAATTGFRSVQHMTNVLRRVCGYTPGACRKGLV
jgi:LacI family transcriptional regulator